jgi:hypothetical protein
MPRFKFSKLVRDKIVDHQIASGANPVYWVDYYRKNPERYPEINQDQIQSR